ncbi:MAG: ABC transporter permease [Anaerolineae bacterium]|nr:ABC transporter permease [Anaerolineae bacterium]
MSQQGSAAIPKRAKEGSPWTGLGAVIMEEMADSLTSARMRILEVLIALTAAGTVFVSVQELRETVGEDPFLLLKLFTTGRDPLPSFAGFLVFLIPLIAIALAFDAVNSEFSRRTLSRILAQPIYRDAFLMGKFLARLGTLALTLTAIWLLIIGMGIVGLGVPPSGEEVARSLWFLLASIFYGGIWLAVAMLFSIVFRQPATAALASMAVWIFFTVFWEMLVGLAVPWLRPMRYGLPEEVLAQEQLELALNRISPNTLYGEVLLALLYPSIRSVGLLLPFQLYRAVLGNPLPLRESLLLVWPHLTGLIAGTILLFALGYILFQRQEIRA